MHAHQLQVGGVGADGVEEPLKVGVADAKLGARQPGGHVGVHLCSRQEEGQGRAGSKGQGCQQQQCRQEQCTRGGASQRHRMPTPLTPHPTPPHPIKQPTPQMQPQLHTAAHTCGSTSGLMRIITRAVLPTLAAAACMGGGRAHGQTQQQQWQAVNPCALLSSQTRQSAIANELATATRTSPLCTTDAAIPPPPRPPGYWPGQTRSRC